MTLFQMLCSLLFLTVMRALGLIQYPKPNVETNKKVAPLSFAFVGMVLTGLGALKYLNIPMFNSLRRVTTLFTMWGESYWLNIRSSTMVQLSVWGMIVGAIIAGFFDFDFSAMGYFLVTLNCFFTAAYLLVIAKFGKSQGLNTFGMMYVKIKQSTNTCSLMNNGGVESQLWSLSLFHVSPFSLSLSLSLSLALFFFFSSCGNLFLFIYLL
jgi:solute carrier family 35 protein